MSHPDHALSGLEPRRAPHRYGLVVLAASAGGIPAISRILAALPPTLRVPIAIVQHRSVRKPSLLAAILARRSRLPVKDAEEDRVLAPGTVYLAPPHAHLVLGADHRFRFEDGRPVNYLRSAADPLFASAARELDGRVIAVVLTGGGKNGAASVRDVKARGGVVIAQDPRTAEHPSMPRAAIATGAVDYVLPLDDIAPMIERLSAE